MASIDEEIRLDEEENRRELAFIRNKLPSTIKKFYSDKRAKEEGFSSSFNPEEVFFIVQADWDFQEQNL